MWAIKSSFLFWNIERARSKTCGEGFKIGWKHRISWLWMLWWFSRKLRESIRQTSRKCGTDMWGTLVRAASDSLANAILGNDTKKWLRNVTSTRFALEHKNIVLSSRKTGSMVQLQEPQQYNLDLKQQGSSDGVVPDHILKLCTTVGEDGLSTHIDILMEYTSCACCQKNQLA